MSAKNENQPSIVFIQQPDGTFVLATEADLNVQNGKGGGKDRSKGTEGKVQATTPKSQPTVSTGN